MFNLSRYFSMPFDGRMALPDQGDGAPGTPTAPALQSAETPAPVRVLLVDDHEDTNRSLVLLLGRRGYKVKSAISLHAARQLVACEEFDVLISDMSLPDGSGLDLLSMMGERQPVYGGIVLSGYSEDEDIERSQQAGFKFHLSKPVEVSKLDETIRRLILEGGKTV